MQFDQSCMLNLLSCVRDLPQYYSISVNFSFSFRWLNFTQIKRLIKYLITFTGKENFYNEFFRIATRFLLVRAFINAALLDSSVTFHYLIYLVSRLLRIQRTHTVVSEIANNVHILGTLHTHKIHLLAG